MSAVADLMRTYGRAPLGRIAVVGNSTLNPSPQRAARIDSADLVVRMTSFAVDVDTYPCRGDRVDVVVLHRGTIASPWTFDHYSERLLVLAEPGRRHWEPATMPHWWPSDLGLLHLANDLFSDTLNQELGLRLDEVAWATTGTLATWTMMRCFPSSFISLAGMSIVDNPSVTRLDHAWGDAVPVTPEHRLSLEAEWLLEQERVGRIEVLR